MALRAWPAGFFDLCPQLEELKASKWCTCGCPSLLLHVESGDRVQMNPNMVADALGRTPEGHEVNLILFQKNGALSILEVGATDWTPTAPFKLSRVEDLYTWEHYGRADAP